VNAAKKLNMQSKCESIENFEQLVEEVIEELPDRLRNAVRNLGVLVEEEPSDDLLLELGHNPNEHSLGLYVGVPLPERTFGEEPYLPDQILIFRKPLERMCQTRQELREQIRITVIHELAHYFGFDEDHLQRLGLD
jgi:predicted Zn-dependent protease with MMP-like domain